MLESNRDIVKIYTDGACSCNPGPGGWGAYLNYSTYEEKICGFNVHTTNNRMELTAAIEALKTLKSAYNVELYTDSQYLRIGITEWMEKWINNGWKTSNRKAVKNVDLWHLLDQLIHVHCINWYWIKGHSGNIGNEIADQLAVKGKIQAMQILNSKNENNKRFLD